jgi:hypothetical protein
MLAITQPGAAPFEILYFRPKDEGGIFQHSVEGGVDFLPQVLVWQLEIQDGYQGDPLFLSWSAAHGAYA